MKRFFLHNNHPIIFKEYFHTLDQSFIKEHRDERFWSSVVHAHIFYKQLSSIFIYKHLLFFSTGDIMQPE